MNDLNDSVLENRLRRMARRMGWRIIKSRARTLHSNDLGKYMLVDNRNVVFGGGSFDATLEDIEFWLNAEQGRLAGEWTHPCDREPSR